MQRCLCRPINVIIFEIQHLHVCGSFSASDGIWWPEFFERHNIWSIRKDQPSIPFLGRDLILGAAAAGSSRLTAIKLGMILKMLGMYKTRRCQRGGWGAGSGGGGGTRSSSLPPPDRTFRLSRFSRCDRSKCHPPEHFSYKYASSPLMSPSRHKQIVKPS